MLCQGRIWEKTSATGGLKQRQKRSFRPLKQSRSRCISPDGVQDLARNVCKALHADRE
ncbi:hypothetical protein RESH_01721 [Rhodopirellula europaea SH398]|uniref:Uncharacterized protein n=1 Tax=Rhodopirellula europaea SH398 TaxID=1263868 RepID=M5SJ41_9BACT|nr:hypothetical protein RESH_01721 [Rhodopirellula europaea SH398]